MAQLSPFGPSAELFQPPLGVVLAGGKSSRMGQDKASLPWGQHSLLGQSASLLHSHCSEVCISSSSPGHVLSGLRRIPDRISQAGPMAGIAAAMEANPHCQHFLVLGVDLPLMAPALLAYLLQRYPPGKPALVYQCSGQIHPLVGIYQRQLLPQFRLLLAQGKSSLYKMLLQIPGSVLAVPPHLLLRFPQAFANFNTPIQMQTQATIKVLFFGYLAERLGRNEWFIAAKDTDEARQLIAHEYPELSRLNYLLACNQEQVSGNVPLKPGDELAVMPPFAGG